MTEEVAGAPGGNSKPAPKWFLWLVLAIITVIILGSIYAIVSERRKQKSLILSRLTT